MTVQGKYRHGEFGCSFFRGGLHPGEGSASRRGVCIQGGRDLHPGGLGRLPVITASSGSHCSGRYASYWNVFLLTYVRGKFLVQIFLAKSLCFPCLEKWTSKFPVSIFSLYRGNPVLLFLPPVNEVFGKVMFLQVSVCAQGEGISV